jgi:hypothetical protein
MSSKSLIAALVLSVLLAFVNGQILLQNYPSQVALSVAAVPSAQGFAVGLTLNNPRSALFYDAQDGHLRWNASSVLGGDVFVKAPAKSNFVAALDISYDTVGYALQLIDAASGKLGFQFVSPKRELSSEDMFSTSVDGLLVVVLSNALDYGQGAYGIIRFFRVNPDDLSQTKLVANVTLNHMQEVMRVQISSDGSKVFVMVPSGVLVYDGKTAALIQNIVTGIPTYQSSFCVSGDGSMFAMGGYPLGLFALQQGQFAQVGEVKDGVDFVTACAYNHHGDVIAFGKVNGDNFSEVMFELRKVPAADVVISTYNVIKEAGDDQDEVTALAFSADDSILVASTWGHPNAGVMTVYALQTTATSANMTLAYSHKTPGSMFGVAVITRQSDGATIVAAAGKHEHANEEGSGGDFLMDRV